MAISKQPSIALFPTAFGWMALAGSGHTVVATTFGHKSASDAKKAVREYFDGELVTADWFPALRHRLVEYIAGVPDDFLDVSVSLPPMTQFAETVIDRCRLTPYGNVISYSQLAADAGSPRAARAVGNIMRANRCPLIVPCHRVVHADGTIGHYNAADGARMKQRLLAMESASNGLPAAPLRPIRSREEKRLQRA